MVRKRLVIGGALLGLAAATTVVAVIARPTGSAESVAVVDGQPITNDDVREYSLAFTDQYGEVHLTEPYVLLSLINQALVLHEADRLGIEVAAADLDATVERALEEELVRRTVERSGGISAYRQRLATKLRFDAVRQAITGDVTVSDGEVRTYIDMNADQFVGMGDAESFDFAFGLVRDGKTSRAWGNWLAERRACADIRLAPTAVVPPETFSVECPSGR